MNSRDEVLKKLSDIIKQIKETSESIDIGYYTELEEDLGFDSIEFVQLILIIESEFDIEIEEEMLTIEKLHDIDSIIQLLLKD